MNPLFRIDFSISDSLKIVRKSVLIYETIISYLILKALAKVIHLSLDSLMYPDLSPDEAGQNEMKLLYMNCPPEMRETLLRHTRGFVEELKELSKKLETK